jgi:hypothetical protein
MNVCPQMPKHAFARFERTFVGQYIGAFERLSTQRPPGLSKQQRE